MLKTFYFLYLQEEFCEWDSVLWCWMIFVHLLNGFTDLALRKNAESCMIFYCFYPLYITFPTSALRMIWMIYKHMVWKYFPLMLKKGLSVRCVKATFFSLLNLQFKQLSFVFSMRSNFCCCFCTCNRYRTPETHPRNYFKNWSVLPVCF